MTSCKAIDSRIQGPECRSPKQSLDDRPLFVFLWRLGKFSPSLRVGNWARCASGKLSLNGKLHVAHVVESANLKEIVKELYKSAAVTVAASILPLLVFLFGDGFLAERLWLQLFIGMTTAILGWFAGLFWFRHPLRAEIGTMVLIVKRFLIPAR